MLEGLMVADPETLQPVPQDGAHHWRSDDAWQQCDEGLLEESPRQRQESFAGGWFHSGDLSGLD